MFQGAGFNQNLSVVVSPVATSLSAPSTLPQSGIVRPLFSGRLRALTHGRPWTALFAQPDLALTTRRFASRSTLYLSSGHPDGKSRYDYDLPSPGRTDRDHDSGSGRRSGDSDSGRSSDKSRDDNRDTGRSGGSSEKSGFAGLDDDTAGAVIWRMASLDEKRPDDNPAKKGDGNPDREGKPSPIPRDPSGELNPRRAKVPPDVSWGGGGDDGFGGGSGNDGLF